MIYLYQNPQTGEVAQVSQGMNEVHEYFKNGQKWNRLFTIPNATIDTKIDPFSSQQFLDKTNKCGTLGDLFDRSKELSEARKEKVGFDPIQKKTVEDYEKKYKVKHPSNIKGLG